MRPHSRRCCVGILMRNTGMKRREFLKRTGVRAASVFIGSALSGCSAGQRSAVKKTDRKPNLVFVFADQWRAQSTGYAGNKDVKTPNLDKLAEQGVNFSNAVSGCPVCSPYRASLITGRYPLSHGVFLNDVLLNDKAVSLARAYNRAGYETAYIGKWHLDGNQRSAFIP